MIQVEGSQGRADYYYTTDRLDITADGQTRTVTAVREDLLENLLAFRRGDAELLVPLVGTGAFMRVLDAVARADEPVKVDPRAVTWSGDGPDRTPYIDGIEDALQAAVQSDSTFTELGLPWTHRGRDTTLVRGSLGEHEVLVYRDGGGTISTSTPRPYLHPVRTLGGVVVSATHPSDHDWHTGVGMAIPDVNGTNFWGGGTYVHGRGYAIENDHGVVRGGPVTEEGTSFRQTLEWIGAGGDRELTEERRVEWAELTPHAVAAHLRQRPDQRSTGPARIARQQGPGRRRLRRILLAPSAVRGRGRLQRRRGRRGRRARHRRARGWPGPPTSGPGRAPAVQPP